jgi:cytidylate kinase
MDKNKKTERQIMIRIAIDGPSGAGKSTIAKGVAKQLGIIYVDTGALYRTVGYYVRQKNVDPKNAEAVAALLPDISVEVKYENGAQHVYLNGEDLGDRIRTPEMSMYASAVSAIPKVREFLLNTQKDIARKNSVIMDGRDIGTVILPDADVKIFMFASNEARAKRRYRELTAKGVEVRYEDVLNEMIERDNNDKNRDVAPAVPAADAIMLDNSDMSVDENIDAVLNIIKEKGKNI